MTFLRENVNLHVNYRRIIDNIQLRQNKRLTFMNAARMKDENKYWELYIFFKFRLALIMVRCTWTR